MSKCSVAVQGTGQPPYSLLLFPYGPIPFPNNTEVRKIQNISFPGDSTSLSFNLNYPENSSFVAVVSDSSGFGTGGISTVVTVLPSSDSTCYNSTHGITLPWYFYIDPIGGIAQCQSLRLWWDQDLVDGNLTFYGLIPGGTSFFIPQGYYSTNNNTGTGFSWTVDVAGGTDVLVIGSDDRGFGSGGEADFTVASSTNTFCLSGSSPSSLLVILQEPAIPQVLVARRTPNNTGVIAGGVAGGLAFMVALASITFFYARRLGYAAISKERPVNVLYDDEDGDGSYQDLPDHYEAEPYLVSDPNFGGPSVAASTNDRLSP
ncbi:hypothetical protein EI94DRAFT_1709540 [Lactarius quietus]|nr:hypothetical protein EI94DRAFT_1709540 [Lactarius quietus]